MKDRNAGHFLVLGFASKHWRYSSNFFLLFSMKEVEEFVKYVFGGRLGRISAAALDSGRSSFLFPKVGLDLFGAEELTTEAGGGSESFNSQKFRYLRFTAHSEPVLAFLREPTATHLLLEHYYRLFGLYYHCTHVFSNFWGVCLLKNNFTHPPPQQPSPFCATHTLTCRLYSILKRWMYPPPTPTTYFPGLTRFLLTPPAHPLLSRHL